MSKEFFSLKREERKFSFQCVFFREKGVVCVREKERVCVREKKRGCIREKMRGGVLERKRGCVRNFIHRIWSF